ncbi:hypothetical protein [Dethiothermospora halolimnae]|uniref:hypothetical protein n=1 Tax=Dethiothermospora halolimnae TaxID=3114390 RepID=UPI003CCC2678
MSITKRVLIFILCLFATIFFMSVISTLVSPYVFNNFSAGTINNIIYPLLFTLGLFFFGIFQGLIKYLANKKILAKNTLLLSLKIGDKLNLTERLWYYSLLLLIYFLPAIRSLSLQYITISRIVLFIISVALSELLLRTSYNSIKIHFLRQGFLLNGFDVRIDIPLEMVNSQMHNETIYYSYKDIEGYLMYPNHIDLYLTGNKGIIYLNVDDETQRQVMGILVQQKIPKKKF